MRWRKMIIRDVQHEEVNDMKNHAESDTASKVSIEG